MIQGWIANGTVFIGVDYTQPLRWRSNTSTMLVEWISITPPTGADIALLNGYLGAGYTQRWNGRQVYP